MRCFELPHCMHLLVSTRHSGVMWLAILDFPQGTSEPVRQILARVGPSLFCSSSHSQLGLPTWCISSSGYLGLGLRALIPIWLVPLQLHAHKAYEWASQLVGCEYKRSNPHQTLSSSSSHMLQTPEQIGISSVNLLVYCIMVMFLVILNSVNSFSFSCWIITGYNLVLSSSRNLL